jgi:hypothetical protein
MFAHRTCVARRLSSLTLAEHRSEEESYGLSLRENDSGKRVRSQKTEPAILLLKTDQGAPQNQILKWGTLLVNYRGIIAPHQIQMYWAPPTLSVASAA